MPSYQIRIWEVVPGRRYEGCFSDPAVPSDCSPFRFLTLATREELTQALNAGDYATFEHVLHSKSLLAVRARPVPESLEAAVITAYCLLLGRADCQDASRRGEYLISV